jgi:hypothetical protein
MSSSHHGRRDLIGGGSDGKLFGSGHDPAIYGYVQHGMGTLTPDAAHCNENELLCEIGFGFLAQQLRSRIGKNALLWGGTCPVRPVPLPFRSIDNQDNPSRLTSQPYTWT